MISISFWISFLYYVFYFLLFLLYSYLIIIAFIESFSNFDESLQNRKWWHYLQPAIGWFSFELEYQVRKKESKFCIRLTLVDLFYMDSIHYWLHKSFFYFFFIYSPSKLKFLVYMHMQCQSNTSLFFTIISILVLVFFPSYSFINLYIDNIVSNKYNSSW